MYGEWMKDIPIIVSKRRKQMELCETCKKTNCNKSIVTIQEKDILTTKCIEYEKDEEKIKGYKKPLERTAKFSKSIMGLYSPSWN